MGDACKETPISKLQYVQSSPRRCSHPCFSSRARRVDILQWLNREFCSGEGSTDSVEDRGQKERESGGGSPLVRGSGKSSRITSLDRPRWFQEVEVPRFRDNGTVLW